MIIQVSIGESITVMMDDEITEQRPLPEQVEDYLTRLRRQAVLCYIDLPEAKAVIGEDDA